MAGGPLRMQTIFRKPHRPDHRACCSACCILLEGSLSVETANDGNPQQQAIGATTEASGDLSGFLARAQRQRWPMAEARLVKPRRACSDYVLLCWLVRSLHPLQQVCRRQPRSAQFSLDAPTGFGCGCSSIFKDASIALRRCTAAAALQRSLPHETNLTSTESS